MSRPSCWTASSAAAPIARRRRMLERPAGSIRRRAGSGQLEGPLKLLVASCGRLDSLRRPLSLMGECLLLVSHTQAAVRLGDGLSAVNASVRLLLGAEGGSVRHAVSFPFFFHRTSRCQTFALFGDGEGKNRTTQEIKESMCLDGKSNYLLLIDFIPMFSDVKGVFG